jgi:hypothetical protein
MRSWTRHSASEIRNVLPLNNANSAGPGCNDSTGLAHDLRNLLALVGLHVETLHRLSGPSGTAAADAVHTLLTRGTTLCNKALDCTSMSPSQRLQAQPGVPPLQDLKCASSCVGPATAGMP